MTTLVHGKDRYESVERVTRVLFGSETVASLHEDDLDALSEEIPTVSAGKTIVEVLVEAGVAGSNGEARRLIAGGAISLNGNKVTDDSVLHELTLVKKGKNSFILVR